MPPAVKPILALLPNPSSNVYLLDTNHCSQIIAGDRQVIQEILSRRNEGVAISVIVQGELRFMAEHSAQRTENLNQIQGFLERFDLYPISADISLFWFRRTVISIEYSKSQHYGLNPG